MKSGRGKEGAHNPKVALMPLIQGMLPTLKRAQRRIAEAVGGDPEQFVSHSISELAADYGVSAGSIVIFCKSLGVRGFPALKIALARELSEPVLLSGEKNQQQTGLPAILQGVFERHVESLHQTLKLNPPHSFNAAVKSLLRTRRIVLFSIGLSFPVAYSLYGGSVLSACPPSLSSTLISKSPPPLKTIEAMWDLRFPYRETPARPWNACAWPRNAAPQ
jgi:RpiR family carbohydrate utilization transcriptional regulator